MTDSNLNINPPDRALLSQQNASVSCCKKTEALIAMVIGIIVSLSGIFLLLASFSVLPHGVNTISQLGIGGKVCGGIVIGLGLFSTGYGLMRCNRGDTITNLASKTESLPPPVSLTAKPAIISSETSKKDPSPVVSPLPQPKPSQSTKINTISSLKVTQDLATSQKKWNYIYELGELGIDADEDPIFNPLNQIEVTQFDRVAEDWKASLQTENVEKEVQNRFAQFLNNLSLMSIPRQNEVFTNSSNQLKAYNLLKKGIIYLRQNTINNKDLELRVILQLIISVDECPIAYYSSMSTALHALAGKEDLSGTIQTRCKKTAHQFYAQFRKEIVNQMAPYCGRQETHTPLSIITLIGEDRKIPGYRFSIEDKQADLKPHHKGSILKKFDELNTVSALINYFLKNAMA